MLALVAVDLFLDAAEGHVGDFFDPSPNVEHLLLSYELFQSPEGQLVAALESTIVFAVLLYGVVGEVDEVVVDVLSRKGLGGGADVGLFEEVNGEVICQQNPRSDVELAIVNQ